MERQGGARRGPERPLFGCLVASRPERPGRHGALALAISLGGHALLLVLAGWATTLRHEEIPVDSQPVTEYLVDLRAPFGPVNAARPGESAVKGGGRPAPARPAPADPAPSRAEERAAARRFLSLAPPAVTAEETAPAPTGSAAPRWSEYGGLGNDTVYSAAEILADHHEKTVDQLAAGPPRIVSFTQAPALLNEDEVRERLEREYPMYLQDSGIGGRVVLWFLLDESGSVRKWLLKQSSGHKALDRAAMKVVDIMRFRPAVNYDHNVAVWVAVPIVFRVEMLR